MSEDYEREIARLERRMDTLIDARNATIARASKYEAALRRIALQEKSGELWAAYNARDAEGRGEDEPDFEAIMDRLIRIARDALKEGSWFCAEHQVWHSPVAPCPKHPNGPPEMEGA